MLQFLWLARLRERWLGKLVGHSRKRCRPARPSRYRRPHLEVLEDRLVPSGGGPAPGVDPSTPALLSPSPSSPPPPPPWTGTWTKVAGLPPQGAGTMLLLPNGDVMMQGPGTTNTWYELRPDDSGNYASGTVAQMASMSLQRLYFGSAVLPSDKVFVVGGEYSGVLGAQNFTNTGEIYDIATNTWTSTPNFPESNFGDDPTILLPNGDVLCGDINGPQTYLYNPSTNTFSPGPMKLDNDESDEETWIKLPPSSTLTEGGVLSYSLFASDSTGNFMGQVYDIANNQWIETQDAGPIPLLSSRFIGYELGGGVVLPNSDAFPNGEVFQIGGNGNTALFDPSTLTWSAGPQIIDNNGNLRGADDASASVLPNGQVIFSADAGPTNGTFASPTELFDYNYLTNKITQLTGLPAAMVADFSQDPAFITRTLILPNGQMLLNDGVDLYVFTLSVPVQSASTPSISSIVNTGGNTYQLTGTELTGISEGTSYGDDVNVSENYPIVQLTGSNGRVYYATTSNWSNVGGVSAVSDTTPQTVDFTLPSGLPNDHYQVSVSASGIASPAFPLTVGFNPVQTTAQAPATMTFSTNTQKMQLTADVSEVSGGQTVNTGTVTFTVQDSKGNTVGRPVQSDQISNGIANANFTLPANEAAGTYTIGVSYSDSSNTFMDDDHNTSATFTVNPANATIAALPSSTTYNPNKQSLTLNANVSDTSISTDTVNEGTVTFTVSSGGKTLGTAVTGNVVNGAASATFALPAGEPPGIYTIAVKYSDSAGNVIDTGDTPAALTISPDNVTTSADSPSVFYSLNTSQTVQLTATVSSGSLIIREGTVTFTVTDSNGNTVGSSVQAPVVAGTTSGGTANADFPTAGLAAGSYTIGVLYSDGSAGNFTNGVDNPGTLTVNPAPVTTTVEQPANLTFSTAPQPLELSATVADADKAFPNDIVKEGTVTFSIESGSTIIDNATANVVNGVASTKTYTWPAGRSAGTYNIVASYSDNSPGDFTDSKQDIGSTLTVAAANVTVASNNPPNNPLTVVASSNAQNVTLTANVADASISSISSDIVNEGTVTFTVEDSNGNIVGSAVDGPVIAGTTSGGTASANYKLPAGLAVGTYTILVHYNDSKGNDNFSDNGDTSGTLIVNPADVATTASGLSTFYSPNGQSLALSATVTDDSISTDTVNTGRVTFTVQDSKGKPVGSPVQSDQISNGIANANFTLPANEAPGTYTISVSYSDSNGNSNGNFIDNGDTGATLIIKPASVTTTAVGLSAAYSPNGQPLALSATVTDDSISTDTVNEGAVTFTVSSGGKTLGTAVTGNVVNGAASATFTLPPRPPLGIYTVAVKYSDGTGNSTGNFTDSKDINSTLTVGAANVTTTAGSLPTVYYSSKGQSLALSATVTDDSIATDTVGEGTVTFTVKDSKGNTVGSPVQSPVSAGANFNLPGGQALGTYTIVAGYSDSNTGNYSDNPSGDTSSTFQIAAAQVTIKAIDAIAASNSNAQNVTLTANVADTSIPTDTVNEGTVTFTVEDSSGNTIGSPVQGTVIPGTTSGGTASAVFAVPSGLAFGNYSIVVSYLDSSGHYSDNNGEGDTPGTLTVGPASVTTTAGTVSYPYSPSSQSLALSATLANATVPGDTVTEGTVTFTVTDSKGNPVGSPVQGTVTGGQANANFTAPVGLNVGSYTITVSYSDSNGLFTDGGDTGGTLTIAPAGVTTTAASTNTTFSTGPQTVALNAAVTDPGSTLPNVVNAGVVTFTILSGPTVLGSAQAAVNGGTAHADFTLPAGLVAGNYTILVHYSDSQGNFSDTSDKSATLAVGAAATAPQLLAAHFNPNYSNATVTETITAHVASSTLVNRGVVTFALSSGQTIAANVDGNGNAAVVVTLPMLDMLNPQSINVSYADASHNLASSTGAGTASWQYTTPLLPSYAAFNPNSVTMDLFGLFITFTNGVLTEIDYGSTHLVFSYNTFGQLDQVTFDGMNLLP